MPPVPNNAINDLLKYDCVAKNYTNSLNQTAKKTASITNDIRNISMESETFIPEINWVRK